MFGEEAALKTYMQLQDNNAQLERLGITLNAQERQIPTTFAANITNTTMLGVNEIMRDGNLTATAKQGAIQNLITYANEQIKWAEAFYATSIPKITAPAVK
jgi:hypothetical protein